MRFFVTFVLFSEGGWGRKGRGGNDDAYRDVRKSV